jgi:pyruvate dehydrogenase E1 component alpha subunit/2-oxoisovalerate dehydrogenase E1 component alpha subunit
MSRWGKRQLHELYYYMKLTRRVEEEIARLHREYEVEGPIFFGVGQEAVSIGATYGLDASDVVASTLPSLGHLLVRGIQPVEVFAHFLGKETGPTRGRDGSILWGDLSRGVVSPAGHIAAHVGVMAGVALASKSMSRSSVAVALADERAAATGDFHEGLNFAAVHRLPFVVVVDHTASSTSGGHYLYEMTRGYGVPSLPVDGVDILQVLQVIETAVERARDGKGPTLVEVRTARGGSHGLREESIPFPLVSGTGKAPVDPEARSDGDRPRDPVQNFESFLVDHDLLQPVERGLLLDRIEHLVVDGLRIAREEPFPDAGTLASGVFSETPRSNWGEDSMKNKAESGISTADDTV